MLIEMHMIQNHAPANLNRDDLGAPKTCYFGGVLRSRISSQCIKRSIRMSGEFQQLLGGIRTRQVAQLIAKQAEGELFEKATSVLKTCGLGPKAKNNSNDDGKSAGIVYVTQKAVDEMYALLKGSPTIDDKLAKKFAQLIAEHSDAPDIALFGRMLEPKKEEKGGPKVWARLNLTVEAALQVAHAISTHDARPEVDYYVAIDDIAGENKGAGYVDEATFSSACFYKYFSINWEALVANLKDNKELAAHTVGAFIRGAAMVNPTGKQNSFAAHNPPDGILIEIRNTPISYANAFARPVDLSCRDNIISQSIVQLGHYMHDIDTGYGKPKNRFWFSPNLRHSLKRVENKTEIDLAENNIKSLEALIPAVIQEIGYNWNEVQGVVGVRSRRGLIHER